MKTHRDLYTATSAASDVHGPAGPAILKLMLATAAVAVVSQALVGSVEVAAQAIGTTELFAGVVVVALVGNAAEHYSAVSLAWKGQMDAALQISVGSSTQIALFVAPALVFLSYAIGCSSSASSRTTASALDGRRPARCGVRHSRAGVLLSAGALKSSRSSRSSTSSKSSRGSKSRPPRTPRPPRTLPTP